MRLDYFRGIHQERGAHDLEPGQLADARNMHAAGGALSKRTGYTENARKTVPDPLYWTTVVAVLTEPRANTNVAVLAAMDVSAAGAAVVA